MEGPTPRYCYRHPDRETGLSCSECDRPICWECMTPAAVGLRCPDHSGKPQGIQKVAAAASGVGSRNPYLVTMVLISINVAVYLAELAIGSPENGTDNWIYYHGTLFANLAYNNGAPAGVANGEWWRLITSAFLHFGIIHIGLNMVSLYFGGRILEMVIGRWRFLVLYLVCAMAGSAGALWLSPNEVTAGASGAIFGVFGALLVLERRGTIHTGGQILVLIILNLVFDVAIPGISLGGHIGGLIAGIVIMLAYLRFRRDYRFALASAAAVLVASVVIAYAVI